MDPKGCSMKADRQRREEWKNGLFSKLWSSKKMCPQNHTDLTFVCLDGQIRAHKTLVKKFCPTVARIFDTFQNLSDSGEISILVPEVKLRTAQNFLQILYTGSINLRHKSEIDELQFFGFRQLGFFIQFNWVHVPGFVQCEYANISITTAQDLNQSLDSSESLSLRISSSSETGSAKSGSSQHSRSESNVHKSRRKSVAIASRKYQSCSLDIALLKPLNGQASVKKGKKSNFLSSILVLYFFTACSIFLLYLDDVMHEFEKIRGLVI